MWEITEQLEYLLVNVCNLLAVLVELWGTALLVIVLYKEVRYVIKDKFVFSKIVEEGILNRGLSSVIEIYMASELLKSVTTNDLYSLINVGLLVLLRVFMTYALHWEGKHKNHPVDQREVIKEEEISKID